MQWAKADDGTVAEMSFTDDHSESFLVSESFTHDMLLLDILGNTEIQGIWAFRVDEKSISTPGICKPRFDFYIEVKGKMFVKPVCE